MLTIHKPAGEFAVIEGTYLTSCSIGTHIRPFFWMITERRTEILSIQAEHKVLIVEFCSN